MTTPIPEVVRFATAWLAQEDEAGRAHGPLLLTLPAALWRAEMQADPELRRYGTLRFLLDAIRRDLFQSPILARERAAVVVEFAERANVPHAHYRAVLTGLAWKEYANALHFTGAYPEAISAAQRARSSYERIGSLASDAAKAHLVEALAYREQGRLDEVLAIARKSASVFRQYADSEAYMHARMTEALVLSDSKRFCEAMAVLAETAADAEARGDRHTLAICLHNSAECARSLGEHVRARELDRRALAHFESLGTSVEKPRIRWSEALTLADEGNISAALMELYRARADFLALGMNGAAADCGLELVRLRFDRGEDVTSDCVELIETLAKAGMIQPAIEALAYLREQARRGTISAEKIKMVREFLRDAMRGPARLFVPPREDGV